MEYQHGLRRAFAHLVDLMLIIPMMIIISSVIGRSEDDTLTEVITTTIFLSYLILAEGTFGQTLGKRLFGVRVKMENGDKCTLKAAFIRNLLRIIDAIPSIYIVGILVITFTAKKQRVGDLAAKTVVVRA